MIAIIKPVFPEKSSIPRPTREVLFSVINRMYDHALNQTHDLRKGPVVDQFFAAAIDSVFSNLLAMTRLSSAFPSECGALFRVLVETCVDFFWVASFTQNQPNTATRLADNFFAYADWKFRQQFPGFEKRFADDVFLRDVQSPYSDKKLQDKSIAKSAGYSFGDSWREERSTLPEVGDITWKGRASIAAPFVEKEQNLKGAPYLPNLIALSSYSHFDPAHLAQLSDSYKDAIFDRNINIALGFAHDMLLYSFKYKGWQPSQPLCMLNHEFVYFST